MKDFIYNIPTRVYFGREALKHTGKAIGEYSTRSLLVYGSDRIKRSGLFGRVKGLLEEEGIKCLELGGIQPNPTLESVHQGIKMIKENQLDFVLAVGGGSVIDAAKGMAAGAASGADPWDFCLKKREVTGSLPIGAVLTLSATGSEMNGNSVISNTGTGEKLYFGSPLCRPVFSILDPSLTFTVPPDQTAFGVADIFTHVTEQYFGLEEEAGVTDRISEGIMLTCLEYGETAVREPEDYEARANLMWASSLALNNLISCGKSGGDWATHMIEHELSAAYDISHGLGLAILLPNWMSLVLSGENEARFARYAEKVFSISGKDPGRKAAAGIKATREFFKRLGIPSTLREIGIDDSRISQMAEQAVRFGDIGMLKKLNSGDVEEIFRMSL